MALGYSVGTMIGPLSCKIVRRSFRSGLRIGLWIMLFILGSSSAAWSLTAQYQWQVDVRELMGMDAPGLHYPVAVAFVALLVVVVLVLLARLIRAVYRQYVRFLSRYLPHSVARGVGIITAMFLVVGIADKIVGEVIFPALDRRYVAVNNWYDGTIQPPTSPHKSGGADSLVA